MNPSDLKLGKKKMDVMDLAKKPRKMDKLDKISGLGAANRSNFLVPGFQKRLILHRNVEGTNERIPKDNERQ